MTRDGGTLVRSCLRKGVARAGWSPAPRRRRSRRSELGGAPLVHAATKQLLASAATADLADGIVAERLATTALFGSADGREGFAAFLARRRPTFTGR